MQGPVAKCDFRANPLELSIKKVAENCHIGNSLQLFTYDIFRKFYFATEPFSLSKIDEQIHILNRLLCRVPL